IHHDICLMITMSPNTALQRTGSAALRLSLSLRSLGVARVVKPKRHIIIFIAGIVLGVAGTLGSLLWLRQPSAREISDALDATVIPKLSLRETPYSEAVAFVLRHVRSQHPELRGVQFVSHFPAGASLPSPDNPYFNGNVTLELTAIPANEALRYIAAMSSLGYTIRDGTIYFYALTTCSGVPPPLTVGERLSNHANGIYWHVR